MLTIQSAKTAFKGYQKDLSQEEIQALREEREYRESLNELEDQRDEFINLAHDKEIKMPKAAKIALEGGAILTTALLGGMASGWGTKKTIQGLSKLNKSQAMKNVKTHMSATKDFVKKSAKTIKADFIKSEAYTMPANFIKKYADKFANSKIGKPIVKFFAAIGKGVKYVFNSVKKGIKYVSEKVKGIINKTNVEKATVNTVGVSGGIASGVTALKEKQGED